MKKYIQLLFVALFATLPLVLTSCGDDDNEPADDSIVGTWLLSIRDDYDDSIWYCQYNFKANGTFECKDWDSDEREPSYEDFGTWVVSGDVITITWDGDEEYPEIYRFSLDGNRLIIYDYEEPGPNVFVRR